LPELRRVNRDRDAGGFVALKVPVIFDKVSHEAFGT